MKFGRFGSFLKGNRKIISHCVCVCDFFQGVFLLEKWPQKHKNPPAPLLHKSIAREAEPQRASVRWGFLVSAVFMNGQNGRKDWSRNVSFPKCCSVFQMFGFENQMMENAAGNRHQTTFQSFK